MAIVRTTVMIVCSHQADGAVPIEHLMAISTNGIFQHPRPGPESLSSLQTAHEHQPSTNQFSVHFIGYKLYLGSTGKEQRNDNYSVWEGIIITTASTEVIDPLLRHNPTSDVELKWQQKANIWWKKNKKNPNKAHGAGLSLVCVSSTIICSLSLCCQQTPFVLRSLVWWIFSTFAWCNHGNPLSPHGVKQQPSVTTQMLG